MGDALITKQYLTDIANAIRIKNRSNTTYKPSEMAAAINALQVLWENSLRFGDFPTQYAISDIGFTWDNTAEENTA